MRKLLRFKILEHKADLKIKVFGKTKKELFSNALLAMENALKAKLKKENSKNRNIKIKSFDLTSLLVDFLNEALYLIQTNKEVYQKIKFNKLTDKEIKAQLLGKKVERFKEDIKAVTYHQLCIQKKENKIWEAIILFDI